MLGKENFALHLKCDMREEIAELSKKLKLSKDKVTHWMNAFFTCPDEGEKESCQ